jgi:hypothetical protein
MEIILDYDPVNKWEGCAFLPSEEGIIAWIVKELDQDGDADEEGVSTYWTYERPYHHWFEHYPLDSESTRYAGKIRCSSLAAAKWLLANWKLEAA